LSITLATVPVALLTACSAGSTGTTADTSSSAASPSTEASAGPGGVDIGGRNIYLDCRGTSENDSPTVILVSGYHDSSDVWNQTDVLSLIGTAKGPPVQEALAQGHRVCSYDRPGTLRYIEGLPLTDRSTPVSQPRDAADLVSELNATLAAAGIPEPYVLVGHSSAV
jgi:pimeloyl-ACP methyl ester carboxylesterase